MTAGNLAWQIAAALQSAASHLNHGPERQLLEDVVAALSLSDEARQQSAEQSEPQGDPVPHR